MAIPGTGQIGLSTVQGEFGGTNPINMSEYRGSGGVNITGQMSLGAYRGTSAAPAVSHSVSPTSRSDSNAGPANNFSAVTASSSPAPTEYYWYFSSTNGGTWSIVSGGTSSSCSARVAAVGPQITAYGSLTCRVLINGTYYYATSALSYTNTLGGNS
jgi:hypothetical protein